MGKFTKIPQDTFNALQLDAGVILTDFDPTDPQEPDDEDILCATTGGITVTCTPTFSDLGSDVDNVPANMMELMHLDSWTCTLATTSIGTSPKLLRWALGSADITAASGKVKPRKDLQQTDFQTIWWVGDRADGGAVAVKLLNGLSTGGMSLKTTKNGKGQTSITITGHMSINAQNDMPMEFYSLGPSTYTVTYNSVGGSAVDSETVDAGTTATEPTAPTKTGFTFDGWYKEAQYITEWDFTDPVNENLTLYAKWTENT